MDTNKPHFDADGRDPALIDDFRLHICQRMNIPFDIAMVPQGISAAEWWAAFRDRASNKSRGLPFGETAQARGEDNTTTAERWMLHKYGARLKAAAVEYLDRLKRERGPEDAFVREMRKTLGVES